MDVEIVAIGNELLLGETVDTNSAYAARRLAEIGARVSRVTVVGDDRERMRQALEEARERSRWVITTGGLGPTQDDLTRQVVAELFDAPLVVDAEVLADVEERFRRFGYAKMPESNRSQAEVPRGARVIPNRHGTAPGLVIEGRISAGTPGRTKNVDPRPGASISSPSMIIESPIWTTACMIDPSGAANR